MGKKRKTKGRKSVKEKTPSSQNTIWFQWALHHFKKHFWNYLSLLSLAIGIAGLSYYFHDKKLTTLTGSISRKGLAEIKYLALGSSVRFKIDTPQGVLFKDGNQPLISMNLENGKLSISAIIRDLNGQIIAELVNNEWQINEHNMFDRNYNDSAIEVKDKTGKVVLQAAHFGDTIFFAGILHCKNGRTVSLHPIQKGEAVMELIPPGKESDYQINPIFKYPSDRYFGSCPGLNTLEKELLNSTFTTYNFKTDLDICMGGDQKRID